MKKSSERIVSWLIVVIVTLMLAWMFAAVVASKASGQCLGGCCPMPQQQWRASPRQPQTKRIFPRVPQLAPVQRPRPYVVRVQVQGQGSRSYGSGVLVHVYRDRASVLTNAHVVRDGGPIVVIFPNGFKSAAKVQATDTTWDLALLVIWKPKATPIHVIQSRPQLGQQMTIAGYGKMFYRERTGRVVGFNAPTSSGPAGLFEVSAQAREGDSGGPILNSRGELAGLIFGASSGNAHGTSAFHIHAFLVSTLGSTAFDIEQEPADASPADSATVEQPPLPAVADDTPVVPVVPVVPSKPDPGIRANEQAITIVGKHVDDLADTLKQLQTTEQTNQEETNTKLADQSQLFSANSQSIKGIHGLIGRLGVRIDKRFDGLKLGVGGDAARAIARKVATDAVKKHAASIVPTAVASAWPTAATALGLTTPPSAVVIVGLFLLRYWNSRRKKRKPVRREEPASIDFPQNPLRDDTEARQLLQLGKLEGRDALHDALIGQLLFDKLDSDIERNGENADFAAKLKRRLEDRFNEIVPHQLKPKEI